MRYNRISILLLFALLFYPTFSNAQGAKSRTVTTKNQPEIKAKSLLWEISGNGLKKPSYLYGTHHLLFDSYLNSEPEVKRRFEQSKGVVVETEIDMPKLRQLDTKMMMPNTRLWALLNSEDYELVAKEVKKTIGIEMSIADRLKPRALMSMFTKHEYSKLQATKHFSGQPLDIYFAEQGRKNGEKTTSLETIEQQLDLLYNYHSLEKQAEHLVAYIKEKEMVASYLNQLFNLYLDKDLEGIWALMKDSNKLSSEEAMAYILDDRNKDWMTKLPAIMKEQTTFVAVGAGHLPGENGLLQLLQKAGYKVKPLQ